MDIDLHGSTFVSLLSIPQVVIFRPVNCIFKCIVNCFTKRVNCFTKRLSGSKRNCEQAVMLFTETTDASDTDDIK